MEVGAWIIPTIVTVLAFLWAFKDEHWRGDYNFTPLFVVPAAAFVTTFAWMLYFSIGWALS
jgi:O-antigen/teichoic acid export membrane protein